MKDNISSKKYDYTSYAYMTHIVRLHIIALNESRTSNIYNKKLFTHTRGDKIYIQSVPASAAFVNIGRKLIGYEAVRLLAVEDL